MQTKKRAKSVKFGKQKEESPQKKQKEEIEIVEQKVVPNESAETPEIKTEREEKSVEINEPGAEEIKRKIAEKINSSNEIDSKPEETDLDSKINSEQQGFSNTATSETATDYKKSSSFGSFGENFEESKHKKNNFAFFLIIVIITFIVGLLTIGGFYYFSNKTIPNLTPTPTLIPTVEPSPTEEIIDFSAFSIKVLNGSGISGEAAKVKTQLVDSGFTVDSIGNADDSNFTKTTIATKENVSKLFIDKLIKELEKTYLVEEKIDSLSSSNEADVVITVGASTTK